MENDDYERAGLLSEEPDAERNFGQHSAPLRSEENEIQPVAKALPYRQVGILVFANAMVIAAFQVIYPFISEFLMQNVRAQQPRYPDQMLVELGIAKGADSVGYYSGLFESGLSLAGFVTAIPCSYASDVFGRKPVIVVSMIGTILSLLLFSTSTSFFGLFASRCIGGAFGPNWTWTASFTMLGEITDPATSSAAYSALNVGYSIGTMISPSIGGFLVHPSDHFAAFQTEYWKNNPYALPCFTGIFFVIITTLVILFGLNETLPPKREWARKHQRQTSLSMRASMYSTHSASGAMEGPFNPAGILPLVSARHTREATDDSEYGPASETLLPTNQTATVTVWSVMTVTTIPVLISSFALSFLAAALFAIYALWAFTPIDKGGLGAPESSIGLQLSIRGLLHVLTMAIYPLIEKRMGLYKLYAWSMAMWVLSGLGFPILNLVARANGSTAGLLFQTSMLVWLTIWSFAGFVWTGNPQMVNRVAPSEEALARIIGVSTICTLLGGTIGPVFATSLFQWSISLSFAGGNMVWIIMFIAASVSTWHAFTLREPLTDWRVLAGEPVTLGSVHSTRGNEQAWVD